MIKIPWDNWFLADFWWGGRGADDWFKCTGVGIDNSRLFWIVVASLWGINEFSSMFGDEHDSLSGPFVCLNDDWV